MRKIHFPVLWVLVPLLIAALLVPGVSRAASGVVRTSVVTEEPVSFQYAIYYLPLPSGDPLTVLRSGIQALNLNVKLSEKFPEKIASPVLTAHIENQVQDKYRAPSPESLRYFGRGLSDSQVAAVQQSKQVLVLNFAHPQKMALPALENANRLLEQLARQTQGLVWDEETRLLYTPDEWRKRMIESWIKPHPDISTQFTVHAYRDKEYVRAITLGMAKFGLPDVVVQEVGVSNSFQIGNLLNVFAQSLFEKPSLPPDGSYDLDIKAMKNVAMRDAMLKTSKANAKSSAKLLLVKGVQQKGDPNNRLLELRFDRYPGTDVHARQAALLADLFGVEDEVKYIKHNDELLAASEKARLQLPQLRKRFNQGLVAGEYIQLKAPFTTDGGGTEWMWVEVVKWEGNKIIGLLMNIPEQIAKLKEGQQVEVDQELVFDYLFNHADGTKEGNTTQAIILKMSK